MVKISEAMGELFFLIIFDVFGFALMGLVATNASSAKNRTTSYTGAGSMIDIVVIAYIIAMVVVNIIVPLDLLERRKG